MSLDNPAVHAEGGRDFSPANAKTKAKLPKGIYIIGGLVVADLIIAIIGLTHVASALYIFTMVIELLVVASLFSQVKIARKAALISQGLVIVMIGFVIVSLAQTQIQTSQLSTKYDKTVVDAGAVATQQQETTIDNLTTQINSNHIQVGKLAGVAYARDVLAIFVSLGVIWYLARPGVKTAFR